MLRIEDLSVHYGNIQALKGVSLEVQDGAVVGVIGGNGAGKTTLLNTISGLLKPTRGRVMLDSQRLDHVKPHEIVKMGISHVPEGRRVFAKMTVQENLKMGAFSRRSPQKNDATLKKVMELFPILHERRHQKAGTLSGGEQQMLALGRGLMSEPRILLLDEPSMGLAPIIIENIGNSIEQINALGTSVLLVEQKAPIAFKVSSYIYVMETGKIALTGTPAQLAQDDRVKRVYLGK